MSVIFQFCLPTSTLFKLFALFTLITKKIFWVDVLGSCVSKLEAKAAIVTSRFTCFLASFQVSFISLLKVSFNAPTVPG